MTEPLTLAGGFAPAAKDDWLAEVRRVILRNNPDATEDEFAAAFAKQLVTRTEDGLDLQPLYTADDAPGLAVAPGRAPFIRSTHAQPVPWEIRQRVWPGLAGSSAVSELESGATGVLLDMSSTNDVAAALDGVLLDLAPVSLDSATVEQAGRLLDIWERSRADLDERQGSLGLDPLGDWARTGGAFDLQDRVSSTISVLRRAIEVAPKAQVFRVDGTVWHDAGATDAQELAWTIASGVWLVRALGQHGIDASTAAAAVEFRFAATAEQFPTIAKLRAARWLWARALEAAQVREPDRAMRMNVESSKVMLTRHDVWVNILRSTVATFGAAVGGADSITVLPHDLMVMPGGSPMGRRIARNTQTILQMESNLSRVVDPAGGSWFVESLTKDLAQQAWSMVRQSERDGGIEVMLESQAIHSVLEETRARRAQQIATRRKPITGVSEFPNIDEQEPGSAHAQISATDTRFAPLTLHRLSEDFERQRGRAAAMTTPPVVYLATLGTPAQFTARATFAKNLFETVGIRTVIGPAEDFSQAQTDVVCVCSSDGVYAEEAETAVEALRAAGARRVLLAGRGLNVPGIDEEIGIGVDVLDVLTRTLDEMGVPA